MDSGRVTSFHMSLSVGNSRQIHVVELKITSCCDLDKHAQLEMTRVPSLADTPVAIGPLGCAIQ